jgi:hypothetical protein
MFAKICQDSRLMGDGKKRIDGGEFLIFRATHGQTQGIRPMFQTFKSNSPFSAPREDTARASCGNGAKRKLLLLPTHRVFPLFVHPANDI